MISNKVKSPKIKVQSLFVLQTTTTISLVINMALKMENRLTVDFQWNYSTLTAVQLLWNHWNIGLAMHLIPVCLWLWYVHWFGKNTSYNNKWWNDSRMKYKTYVLNEIWRQYLSSKALCKKAKRKKRFLRLKVSCENCCCFSCRVARYLGFLPSWTRKFFMVFDKLGFFQKQKKRRFVVSCTKMWCCCGDVSQ